MIYVHHYSGPDWVSPTGRPLIHDLYPFQARRWQVVLIMNVHPSPALNPPGLTKATLRARGSVELKIDTDEMPSPNRYAALLGLEGGKLTATCVALMESRLPGRATRAGDRQGAPVSIGREARVTDAATIASLRAGEGSLFFDTQALEQTAVHGDDFFATKTCAAS